MGCFSRLLMGIGAVVIFAVLYAIHPFWAGCWLIFLFGYTMGKKH